MAELHRRASRCPVVRTEDGTWARWTDLSGGADVMGRVDFRATVAWVRETESRAVVRYADGTQDERFGSTFGDYYGYGSSVTEVVEETRKVAERLGARPGSTLIVEARCRVTDHPLLPEPDVTSSTPRYLTVPHGWARPDDPWFVAMAERDGDDGWFDGPDLVVVGETRVADVLLWSSAVADATEEAETLLDAAFAKLSEGLPQDGLESFGERWSRWRSALWRDVARKEEDA